MFYDTIKRITPKNEQETVDKETMLSFIANNDDVLSRENHVAHLTSSAIIVNPTMDKVLFAHHNIYNAWGWVGGHNDGNPDMLHVAIKEAKEETGIKEVAPYSKDIFMLDIISVQNHIKHGKYINDHLHLNVTYLLIAPENQVLTVKNDENSAVKWFDIKSALEHVCEQRMHAVYQKAFDAIKTIKNQHTIKV